MGITVCYKRVELAATERRLINRKVWPDILRVKDILLSMFKLLPLPVITECLLILPG